MPKIEKEITVLNSSSINIACPPFEFLKDAFEQNKQKRLDFELAIQQNGLERDYALFKEGLGATDYLLRVIDCYFGNLDFWRNATLNYLSYIAQIHFSKRTKRIKSK